jgi:hypothetical protein
MAEFNAEVLTYSHDGETRPLPAWARFFVRLGAFVARHDSEGRHLIVGVSVPTRSYAAAFTAAGIVAESYQELATDEVREHFERLLALRQGTAIRRRLGTKLIRGNLIGEVESNGEKAIQFEGVDKYKTVSTVPWRKSSDIEPMEEDSAFVHPRNLNANSAFVSNVLVGVDPTKYASYTNLTCVVVGNKEQIRKEVEDQPLLLAMAESSRVRGSLSDVLRFFELAKNLNDHNRSTIASSYSTPSEVNKRKSLRVAVFDGPSGFLRLRNVWKTVPWIVVIDRTASAAEPAADTFNQLLAQSDRDDVLLDGLDPIPAGVELAAYYGSVQ